MKLNWRALALNLGILLLVTGVVWGLAVWHWEASHRIVSGRDIALVLVALPLLAWTALMVLRRTWRQAGAPAPAVAAPEAVSAMTAGPAPDESTGHGPFALLWQQVVSAAGTDTDALADALAGGELRPTLDAELVDPDGARVLSGRVPGLDAEALGADTPSDDDPAVARTLALLAPLWPGAREAAVRWLAASGDDDGDSDGARPPAGRRRELRVWLAVPESMAAERLPRLRAWAHRQLALPADLAARVQVDVRGLPDGQALLRQADAALAQDQQGRAPAALLVLAAESRLQEAWVERWHAERVLLSGPRTSGRVPGEAAAAVLIAAAPEPSLVVPSAVEGASPPVAVGRLAAARRDPPAAGRGAGSPQVLADTLAAAARAYGAEPSAVAAALTDVDLQPRPLQECLAALQAQCPDLDTLDDVRRLGEAIGDAGLATPLSLLALAATESQRRQAPVAVLCCADPAERLAVVVGPAPQAGPSGAAA